MGVACCLLLTLGLFAPAEISEFMKSYRQAKSPKDCESLLKDFPQKLRSYECYWRTARRQLKFSEAVGLLEKLLAKNPDNHRARLYLGAVHADLYTGKAKGLIQQALTGFKARGDWRGEFWAHIGLHFLQREEGKMAEAALELAEAHSVAEGAEDLLLIDEVQLYRGWLALYQSNYGRAWILFKQLERNARPKIRRDFRADVFDGLAATASRLGRYRDSLLNYQRELEEIKRFKVPNWEADIAYNIAVMASKVSSPRKFTSMEILHFEKAALESAILSGDRKAEGRARLLIGRSLALERHERIANLEQALKILREINNAKATLQTLRVLAEERLDENPEDPDPAFGLIDEAIEFAQGQKSPEDVAKGWIVRSRMRWRVGPRKQAIADSLTTLEAIERIRDLQHDQQVHARVLGRFASVYRQLSGYLLDPSRGPVASTDLDLAFRIIERMRARVLLRSLEVADQGNGQTPGPGARPELSRLRAQIANVQKKLIGTKLSQSERAYALSELEQLEIETVALLEQSGDVQKTTSTRLAEPSIVSLAEVKKGLQEDQALFAFQIEEKYTQEIKVKTRAGKLPGGSWLIAVTRSRARVYRLPERNVLGPYIQLFLGLISRRDDAETRGADLLYQRLFSRAISDLRPEVRRLVVVPDGPLYKIPFGALRDGPQAEPLAMSFQISVAPSATLWLRWQDAVRPGPRVPVLALADPALPQVANDAEYRSAGIFRTGLQLGHLPYARQEARTVVDRLGGKSRLLEGPDASEHNLKNIPLRDFNILHLAAHAVVDHEYPYRSAVVLASGAEEEDGLLQVPEIAELDMEGLVVLLSTCSSATGALLEGEGVMSLARSFFQAGARAVIGNLWPLRDDEAAQLIDDLTQYLADGASLGEALMATQRDWIRDGKPVSAWAGMTLQGDADLVLFPEGRPGLKAGYLYLAALLGLVLVGLIGWLIRHRRRRMVAAA